MPLSFTGGVSQPRMQALLVMCAVPNYATRKHSKPRNQALHVMCAVPKYATDDHPSLTA
jgi:hypothetical protein